ncbi:plasma membrane proteolipid Pmp3 [Coemansia sp. RSA 1365]|nr:plasma membrane proteolipid Pmp3 [Coemansia sp. RSA 1365]
MCACPDLLLVILSIIFPPFGAFLRRGCGADFLINCGLTALGYLPGLIHAWYLICKYPVEEYEMLIDDDEPRRSNQHHVVIISQGYGSPSTPAAQQAESSYQQQQPPPPYQPTQKSPSAN